MFTTNELHFKLFILTIFISIYGCQENSSEENKSKKNLEIKNTFLNEINVDGLIREYYIYLPENFSDTKMPILFAFHGGGGRNYSFPQQEKFEELVKDEELILVFPLSHHLKSNEGEWQLNTDNESNQDINFIYNIINELIRNYHIDSNRIYATGFSLGSMFTYELACHLNSKFTAIASFAGTMPLNMKSCNIKQNVAIMHIHGLKDGIISYGKSWNWKNWNDVGTMMDIPSLINYWSKKFNCISDNYSEFNSFTHITHKNCDGDIHVEHYKLNEIDHSWPTTINYSSTHKIIWDFLKKYNK